MQVSQHRLNQHMIGRDDTVCGLGAREHSLTKRPITKRFNRARAGSVARFLHPLRIEHERRGWASFRRLARAYPNALAPRP